MKDKYHLAGIDGNAFNVMGYTINALRSEGLKGEIAAYTKAATSGGHARLISESLARIDMADDAAKTRKPRT